jgi:hypothetical protein
MASQEQRHFVDAVVTMWPSQLLTHQQLVGDGWHVEETLDVKMLSRLDIIAGQGILGVDVMHLACNNVRRGDARGEGALAVRLRRRAWPATTCVEGMLEAKELSLCDCVGVLRKLSMSRVDRKHLISKDVLGKGMSVRMLRSARGSIDTLEGVEVIVSSVANGVPQVDEHTGAVVGRGRRVSIASFPRCVGPEHARCSRVVHLYSTGDVAAAFARVFTSPVVERSGWRLLSTAPLGWTRPACRRGAACRGRFLAAR